MSASASAGRNCALTVPKKRSTLPRPCGRYGREWIRAMSSAAQTASRCLERNVEPLSAYSRRGTPRRSSACRSTVRKLSELSEKAKAA